MTHREIEKSYHFAGASIDVIIGIATFLLYLSYSKIRFLVYSIIFVALGVLSLILEFRDKSDNQEQWSDKNILIRIKFAEIGSLIFLLIAKIFVIDEANVPEKTWFFFGILLLVPSILEIIACVLHMAVKDREFKKELISSIASDSENIDNQNIKVRMPGRLCAIFSCILSEGLFAFLMYMLADLYRYTDILGTKENILIIWICSLALGVSIYLGNRAKKKGYDCCFASTGISLGTAGLVVAVVLISLAQC